jgi:hypothetical protein
VIRQGNDGDTDNTDICPQCREPYAIKAVAFSLLTRPRMLFACHECGVEYLESNRATS